MWIVFRDSVIVVAAIWACILTFGFILVFTIAAIEKITGREIGTGE